MRLRRIESRAERVRLGLAFGVPLLLYIFALPMDAAYWDVGEMQTVPYILGIAHPPGFPFFTLLGWVFSHGVPFGTPAWRLSLMCAIAMAGAAAGSYLLARELGADARAAVAAAWLFAVGEVAWSRGTRVEVHAFAVLFAMLAITSAVRFRRTHETRALYACALWLGLGLADHPVVMLTIPGVLVLLAPRLRTLRARTGARACAIVLACLSLYLYLPLRSAYVYEHRLDPTLALGVPPGRPYWDYGHPSTWENFKREVLGEDFQAGGTLATAFAPERYHAASIAYGRSAVKEIGLLLPAFGLAGAFFVFSEDAWLAFGVALAGMSAIPFVLNYNAESDVARYFLTSYAVIAAYAAVGAPRVLRALAPRLGESAKIVSAFGLLCLAAHAASVDYMETAGVHKTDSASVWIKRVRLHTPSDAVVIADWYNATPLAYASYAEHRLNKRIIETAWVSDDRPYLDAWLRRFPVYLASGQTPMLAGYRFDLVDAGSPSLYRIRPVFR